MALAAAWAFRHLGMTAQELLQDGIRRFVPFKVAAKGTEPSRPTFSRPRHAALWFDALARSINVHHRSGPPHLGGLFCATRDLDDVRMVA